MPVFSVNDFKEGLDVRKTALTAPGGTLRVLENAVLNAGGEVEKRLAFVPMTTLPPLAQYIFGQGSAVHVFGPAGMGPVNPGASPVPVVAHELDMTGVTGPISILDVEAFGGQFQVSAWDPGAARTWVWWNGTLVHDVGGRPSDGSYSRTYKTKMYRCNGDNLSFSGVNDPSVQDPESTTNPGAGFINVALNDPDSEAISSMEVFYGQMAFFARLTTQLWNLDPDPTQDKLNQVLRIGTMAPHSVLQFGTGDLLFLSDSGVRSLKAIITTGAASVTDVGSAIDPLMIEAIRVSPGDANLAQGIVQPISGRYWLSLGSNIYVLSYFPAANITAWSTFAPSFKPQQFAVSDNRVYVRGDDNVLYLYGGVDGITYDSCVVTMVTPHMDVDNPTLRKRIKTVDVMCEGAWSVSLGMLANNLTAFELVANVVDNTFDIESIPYAGYGTHVGVQLINAAPGPAVMAAVHLNVQEADTK